MIQEWKSQAKTTRITPCEAGEFDRNVGDMTDGKKRRTDLTFSHDRCRVMAEKSAKIKVKIVIVSKADARYTRNVQAIEFVTG